LSNLKVLRSEIAAKAAVFDEIVNNSDIYQGNPDLEIALRLKPETDGLLRAYDEIIAGLETSLGKVKDQGVTPRAEAQPDAAGNRVSPAEAAMRQTMGITRN